MSLQYSKVWMACKLCWQVCKRCWVWLFAPAPHILHSSSEESSWREDNSVWKGARKFSSRYLYMAHIFGIAWAVLLYQYQYTDYKMLEKSFHLWFMLRLSESTDIIGTATNCLQYLAFQFKLVAEPALGELSYPNYMIFVIHMPFHGSDFESHIPDLPNLVGQIPYVADQMSMKNALETSPLPIYQINFQRKLFL